jgi:Transposase DDE domain
MGRQTRRAPSLERLVPMATPLLKEAERQCPRKGPGAKPTIPDWLIAALIMIAVLKRRKTKSAQFRFLCEQRRTIGGWLRDKRFPTRSTYFRRYRRAHRIYREAIRLQGERAIAEGVTDPAQVSVDKSLIEALGPPWHQQQRQAGEASAGVDRDAAWGYSEHTGWVFGYSYEVVVAATAGATVFPLLASFDIGSAAEVRSFADKIDHLPTGTLVITADSGYDANALGERIEYDERGHKTGRRFLCPENPRHQRPKKKRGGADASRARSRKRRQQRRQFLNSRKGRRLYARRKKTVEPFNQWFKSQFELDSHAWHRGLDNNRTLGLAAIFCYQLLVRYNYACGNQNGRIRWITDAL